MSDDRPPPWEVAVLIAELDASIAARLRAIHPGTGWCRSCGVNAPCPTRTLADAVAGVGPQICTDVGPHEDGW